MTRYVFAPRAHIEQIVGKHAVVQQLLNNQWLHLFQIEPQGTAFARWREGA